MASVNPENGAAAVSRRFFSKTGLCSLERGENGDRWWTGFLRVCSLVDVDISGLTYSSYFYVAQIGFSFFLTVAKDVSVAVSRHITISVLRASPSIYSTNSALFSIFLRLKVTIHIIFLY